MALKDKTKSAYKTRDGYAYITKRFVVTRAQSAGKLAAARAMETMGYVVTLKDGWVVREHQDGTRERMIRVAAQ